MAIYKNSLFIKITAYLESCKIVFTWCIMKLYQAASSRRGDEVARRASTL